MGIDRARPQATNVAPAILCVQFRVAIIDLHFGQASAAPEQGVLLSLLEDLGEKTSALGGI